MLLTAKGSERKSKHKAAKTNKPALINFMSSQAEENQEASQASNQVETMSQEQQQAIAGVPSVIPVNVNIVSTNPTREGINRALTFLGLPTTQDAFNVFENFVTDAETYFNNPQAQGWLAGSVISGVNYALNESGVPSIGEILTEASNRIMEYTLNNPSHRAVIENPAPEGSDRRR